MVKGEGLQERLIDFAVEIIQLCGELPKTSAGYHVAGQLLKSGTSPAPNYGEARNAESKRDFIYKMRIVLKELNESLVWLKIIRKSNMISPEKITSNQSECQELCKIIGASIRTAMQQNKLN